MHKLCCCHSHIKNTEPAMAQEGVKVFGFWASPYSLRVEVALKLKGIDYDYIEEDLSNKSPLLLQLNPVHKKVPVLVHNGNSISESRIILEYIDETWKQNPILPQDPYGRAMARFWAKFIDEHLFPAAKKVCLCAEEEQESAREEYIEKLRMLENEVKEKDFFGGDTIGYVDIVGFMVAVSCVTLEEAMGIRTMTVDKFPTLYQWIWRFLDVPAVRECLPPKEKQLANYKARFTPMKYASK